jgi:hypothetical protein
LVCVQQTRMWSKGKQKSPSLPHRLHPATTMAYKHNCSSCRSAV